MGILAGLSRQQRNQAAVGGYFGLAALTLLVAELLWRRGVSPRVTRKFVHVVAGSSPLYVLTVAEDRWARLLPYWLTAALNAAGWLLRWPPSLGTSAAPGIVYFPLVQALLIGWFWSPRHPAPTLAGLLSMALGDASASLVGQQWGRHGYRLPGVQRTLEGSATMFLVSYVTIAATLQLAKRPRVAPRTLRAAALATAAEAISPLGTDNLTVPLVVALSLLEDGG